MTKDEHELLLKDLSARLPYGVIININNGKYREDIRLETYILDDVEKWEPKPYLRPLNSMTGKELDQLAKLLPMKYYPSKDMIELGMYDRRLVPNEIAKLTDFYNAHFFDWRGLIKKDQALEAKPGMYE